MIIGNGLLAKSLREIDQHGIVFFCSGVSDSRETNSTAFEREKSLLLQQDPSQKLIYFSTVSVFNPAKQENAYILHKLQMEKLISDVFPNYLVVRLPNMIGIGGNPANLFPYLVASAREHRKVRLFRNVRRYLLGADQLPGIIDMLCKRNHSGFINVCSSEAPLVKDLYFYICLRLGVDPDFDEIEGEQDFTVDNSDFQTALNQSAMVLSDWKSSVDLVLSGNSESSQFA